MFAGSAAEEFLQPMVVYKSKNVYANWIKNGPVGLIYYPTKSGWFDLRMFGLRFFKLILAVNLRMAREKY